MIVGLAEDRDTRWDASSSDDVLPGQESVWSPDTRQTAKSTITFGPLTIKPATSKVAPRAGGAAAKALDTIAPRKIIANGSVRIWGLPPAVAYTLMALAATGLGLVAYRAIGGGGRRVASNPRRRRGRGRKARGRKR